ncbi:hypothetical protein HK18_09240 [Commensalibacter intestini]|uniref:Uncharacterized protein n=1 Tax=Commensalibacter intestini TaxID=479936 RepID=A0A251ZU78_9PROT|nr:hypothetical protein [Commensalibacter intestini]OUI78221.1 hypothetical protein HK18_09240 [Commensalibacter intestini]
MSFSMKRLALSGLILGGLTLGQVSAANAACRNSAARDAFNVEGLKSELMVTALSCQAQDQYNGFIKQFGPIVNEQEVKLKQHFRTTYGRSAQKAQDDYITQLANVQSSQGLKAGTIFCLQRMSMFDEVKPLQSVKDLSQYADAKDIMQPTSIEVCDAPASSKARATKKRTVRHTKKTTKK